MVSTLGTHRTTDHIFSFWGMNNIRQPHRETNDTQEGGGIFFFSEESRILCPILGNKCNDVPSFSWIGSFHLIPTCCSNNTTSKHNAKQGT